MQHFSLIACYKLISKTVTQTRNSNVKCDNENSITDYTLPDLWKLDTDKTKEEIEKYELIEGLECPMEDLEDITRHDIPNDSNKNYFRFLSVI